MSLSICNPNETTPSFVLFLLPYENNNEAVSSHDVDLEVERRQLSGRWHPSINHLL